MILVCDAPVRIRCDVEQQARALAHRLAMDLEALMQQRDRATVESNGRCARVRPIDFDRPFVRLGDDWIRSDRRRLESECKCDDEAGCRFVLRLLRVLSNSASFVSCTHSALSLVEQSSKRIGELTKCRQLEMSRSSNFRIHAGAFSFAHSPSQFISPHSDRHTLALFHKRRRNEAQAPLTALRHSARCVCAHPRHSAAQ